MSVSVCLDVNLLNLLSSFGLRGGVCEGPPTLVQTFNHPNGSLIFGQAFVLPLSFWLQPMAAAKAAKPRAMFPATLLATFAYHAIDTNIYC